MHLIIQSFIFYLIVYLSLYGVYDFSTDYPSAVLFIIN